MTETKPKRKFKIPHLLWIMVGLLIFAVALTYIIPAGQYAKDAAGNILQDQFTFLDAQTPVNLFDMLMLLMDGLVSQAVVIFTVMATGASITVLLETGAIDDVLDWAIYKLQNFGVVPLISIMFIIMTYIGGFAGSDALVAMVPIGVLFAKRLKLAPIVALGITLFPSMIGFGTGPTTAATPQMIAGVQPYSGFFVRLLIMNIFMVIGLVFLLRYVKKIQANPENSIMYAVVGDFTQTNGDEPVEETTTTLNKRSMLTVILFLLQFVFIVIYGMTGEGNILSFMTAANLVTAIVMGISSGMTMDEIGNNVAKGISQMGFIAFIIGLAGAFTLILRTGNIMDTIVYAATIPLSKISGGWANIGIMLIVSLLNFIIPSAASKAAILIPTIMPITNALGISAQAAVQAFMFGNGFTILISPVLGWTLGSLEAAEVPYDRWVRWVTPIIVVFMIVAAVILYILTLLNW
ncbi:hypothetical protein [Fundicoccus culcitae]|uniref:YfcC family protein n=1 Tax=Fundicoccus culcitae TaxID=2969821 RepID=A0ABY5P4W0_9LACT|nr:hypothetical protein [Fundicoccus culcitae]UUX33789.1 hypothetical protein NRE15_12995 [Fundicoccus culcitae]